MNGWLIGDARALPLADGVVQTVVTSPPYWGLRDYGIDGQIGFEPSPAAYVEALVRIFREIWRVLKDDGTVWLNLGDCYAGSWGAQSRKHAGKHAPNVSALSANQVKAAQIRDHGTGSLSRTPGLKAKDLVGIPWRVAFALQADGWWLRSDTIWAKGYSFHPTTAGSCMPEPVRDRSTRSHEYLFLLTKSSNYFYDAAAVQEKGIWPAGTRAAKGSGTREGNRRGEGYATYSGVRNLRSVWLINPKPYRGAHFATFPPKLVEPCIKAGSRPGDLVLDPFCGSGTVALVAQELGRRSVNIDLNPEYVEMAKRRLMVELEPRINDKQALTSRRHAGFNERYFGAAQA